MDHVEPFLKRTSSARPKFMVARLLRSIWTVVAVATIIRILGLVFYEGPPVDGTGRISLARDWLAGTAPFWTHLGTQAWPDGNYVLPAAVMWAHGDAFWAVRVAYALVGVSNVLAIWLLGRRVVGDTGAIVAAWLVCLNPYHVLLSMTGGSSETPLVTLLLFGFTVLWPVRRRVVWWRVVAAGLLCSLAVSFRYEAILWTLVAGIVLVLTPADRRWPTLRDPIRLAAVAVLGLVSALYPVALMLRWYAVYGDPVYYRTAMINYSQFFQNGNHPLWSAATYSAFAATFWVTGAIAVLSPLVAFVAAYGAWNRRRDAASAPLAYVLIGATAIFGLAGARRTMPLEYRYGLLIDVLACLWVVSGVQALGWSRAPRSRGLAAGLLAASVAVTYATYSAFTFVHRDLLARRLGILSPVQPGQFAGQALARWAEADPAHPRRVLLSACATSVYLTLVRPDLRTHGVITPALIYKDQWRVYDRAHFATVVDRQLDTIPYYAAPMYCHGLGFTDGYTSDPFQPIQPGQPYQVGHRRFTPVSRSAGFLVYQVGYDSTLRERAALESAAAPTFQ